MKKHLFALTAAATFGIGVWQTASAADLPVRPAAPAMVAAPVDTWTGCYIGGNVGGSWGSGEITATGPGGTTVTRSGSGTSGIAGGGQIGCDFQTGPWVFGVRNMFDWSDRERRGLVQTGPFTGYSVTAENNWVDLLTGRIGYAVQPQWLLYFQGGGAWRDNSLRLFNPFGFEVAGSSRTRTGWTIGGGAEWKFTPNWSVFLEYDHADFGSRAVTFTSPVLGNLAASARSSTDMFLVGVNWRPHF